MFQAMGHPKVSVLDGGYKKWVFEKLPIESKDQSAVVEDFNYSLQKDRTWDTPKVKYYEKSRANIQLIDVRPPE